MKDKPSGGAGAPNTLSEHSVWVRRALWLAYFTIAFNLLEGVVAIGFGVGHESVALFGFGVDSLIEVASAALVLWRFRGEQHASALPEQKRERERRATLGIGVLFVALALVTSLGALERVWHQSGPETTVAGIVISSLSLSFMFLLWAGKMRAARALDSATVRKDASCSLACIKLSVILLVGSLVFWVMPSLWWSDSLAALILSALIAKEGLETIASARSPDFDGGCGCASKQ